MQPMKKLFYIVTIALSALVLASCSDDDDYSMNDYWISTATFVEHSDYYYILTDGGSKLWPSSSNIHQSKHDDGDRIFVNYTILGDTPEDSEFTYYTKINGTSDILTKDVFTFTAETTEATKDSIGNDPITIVDTWFTDDYLNIEFQYGGGAGIHFVNLVKDDSAAMTDNGEYILELKHNKNGDPYNYMQWGIASFRLDELQIDGEESIDIFLRATDKDGNYQYNEILTYNYGTDSISISGTDHTFTSDKDLEDALIK